MKTRMIIAGAPRAGKTTAFQFIARRYGCQHISMDSIIAGIEKTFPETGIHSNTAVPVLLPYAKSTALLSRISTRKRSTGS